MKALLIIWIGWGQTQVLAIDHFDSIDECLSASAAFRKYNDRLEASCLPYGQDPRFSAPPVPQSK